MVPSTVLERPELVLVQLSRRPDPTEPSDIEFVNVEDTVLAANKCNCNASDDNPY